MQISVARLQMTLFLPYKGAIMIKKYSVAWQASGWLSCEYSRARRDPDFHRPCWLFQVSLILDFCFICLLRKCMVLTVIDAKISILFFPGRHNLLII